MRRPAALVLAGALLAAGCGDDEDDEDSLEAFCTQIVTADTDITFEIDEGVDDTLAFFLSVEQAAPAEIEDEVSTIVDSLEDLSEAFDESETDPEGAFEAAAAAADFDQQGYEDAVAAVAAYASENCEDVDISDPTD